MKYTFQSVRYMFKNFLYIFPLSVLPAVFLAISLDKSALSRLLSGFFSGELVADFSMIFHAVSIFNFRNVWAWLASFAGLLLMIFCVSLMMALIEKHMRIGKRTFNGVFSKLNDNILSTCGMCLLYAVIYEGWALVLSALLYCAFAIDALVAGYILSVCVFFGMHFVLLYVVSLFYLWLPCLQITGFRSFEALRYSYQLVAPIKLRIVFGQWMSVAVMELLLGLSAVFIPGRFASFVLAALLYAFMTMMFCVRMQVIYFDRAQLERADLKSYYRF